MGAMKDLDIQQRNTALDEVLDDRYSEGYFERAEGSNYRNYSDDPRWNEILNVIEKPYGNQSLTMLDVGAAKGWFVHHANVRGHDAFGVDISRYAVDNCAPMARQSLTLANVEYGLPYATEVFDILTSWEFFEHIPEGSVGKIIDDMYRVLKVGGELWLRIALSDGASVETDVDVTHVTMKPRAWWEKVIAERQPMLIPIIENELILDRMFDGTDWKGRFLVYRKSE
jgi:cyclopropane fatty-acyl-phospholipid synthase-like methyltransferase